MRVEVLYFEGCPSYRRMETLLRDVLAEADIEAVVDFVRVDTNEEAERLQFAGSPTLRVAGTSEGLKSWPTREMIREALAARNLVPDVS
jgi:hypothetical protein